MAPEVLSVTDTPKRLSFRHQLIFLFRDGAFHHMREVQAAGGWRFSARIGELRASGYDIETRMIAEHEYEYRWNRTPKQLPLL